MEHRPILDFHPVKSFLGFESPARAGTRVIAIAVGVSTLCFRSLPFEEELQQHPHFSGRKRFRECANRASLTRATTPYFCFTAMAEISTRALLTRAAAWIVARAGLGSGITFL
jgi:hypothetical protein